MEKAIAQRAEFDRIRYASCWEDADVLMEALKVKPAGVYLSIASAGDNALALLSGNPSLVLAVDINPAQLACVELRKAAFRELSHEALLSFLGINQSDDREATYSRLRQHLSPQAQLFWDNNRGLISQGIIHTGKFEHYFELFRKRVLPLIHGRRKVQRLLHIRDSQERRSFYETAWNSLRWRLLFKVFFSRAMMGRLGRDPEFFAYVETDVAGKIFARAEYALTQLPTDTNPYLEYILTGNFKQSLPFYLRPENFELIRNNIEKLVVFQGDVRQAFERYPQYRFDGFNLSDIFEYMSYPQYAAEIQQICSHANPRARLVYWNMLADRKETPGLENAIEFIDEEAAALLKKDKAFFYKRLVIAELRRQHD